MGTATPMVITSALACFTAVPFWLSAAKLPESGSFRVSAPPGPRRASFATWIKCRQQQTFSVTVVNSVGCQRQLESGVIRHWCSVAVVWFQFIFYQSFCVYTSKEEIVRYLLECFFFNPALRRLYCWPNNSVVNVLSTLSLAELVLQIADCPVSVG